MNIKWFKKIINEYVEVSLDNPLPVNVVSGGASGNAQPSDVITGKTFSNDGGVQTGTLVDKTGTQAVTAWGNSDSDTEIYITVPEGYYPGGEQNLKANDINLLAQNIMSPVVLFGVLGTATNDADATAADIRTGKTAYVNGVKITGTAVF